jgi:hypothetical protein
MSSRAFSPDQRRVLGERGPAQRSGQRRLADSPPKPQRVLNPLWLVFRSKAGPLSSWSLAPRWSAIERQLSAHRADLPFASLFSISQGQDLWTVSH